MTPSPRLLRSVGERVEVQNYIDDTGVQVADVVVGFKYLEKKTVEEIRALPGQVRLLLLGSLRQGSPPSMRLLPKTGSSGAGTLREIEEGEGETAEIARYVSRAIVRCHLGDHESHRRCLRPAPQGKRYPPPQLLEPCLPAFEGRQGDPLRNRRKEPGMLGHESRRIQPARPGPFLGCRRRFGTRGRQDHCPIQWHRHLCGQGHRLPALEAGAAGAWIFSTVPSMPIRTAIGS